MVARALDATPAWMKAGGPAPADPARSSDAAALDAEAPPPRFKCAACGADIAGEDDVLALPGRDPVELHVNPHGIAFRVLTLADAAARVSGPLYPAFTWYPGYAWRVALCPTCETHLGWRYERVLPAGGPIGFFGLIADRLRSG